MDFIRKKEALLALKVVSTICIGRYSGYVSFYSALEDHPTKATKEDVSLPLTALVGGSCAIATVFICKSKHLHKYISWFMVGTVPIGMCLSQPLAKYALRNSSESDWYKYKKLRSLIALGMFSICVLSLGLEDYLD